MIVVREARLAGTCRADEVPVRGPDFEVYVRAMEAFVDRGCRRWDMRVPSDIAPKVRMAA